MERRNLIGNFRMKLFYTLIFCCGSLGLSACNSTQTLGASNQRPSASAALQKLVFAKTTANLLAEECPSLSVSWSKDRNGGRPAPGIPELVRQGYSKSALERAWRKLSSDQVQGEAVAYISKRRGANTGPNGACAVGQDEMTRKTSIGGWLAVR